MKYNIHPEKLTGHKDTDTPPPPKKNHHEEGSICARIEVPFFSLHSKWCSDSPLAVSERTRYFRPRCPVADDQLRASRPAGLSPEHSKAPPWSNESQACFCIERSLGVGARPSAAPCAILGLLRQEEFSFAGVSGPVTFGVSVYSSCRDCC